MTTPRDDIAGLSERLREQTRHWTGIMSRHPAFLDPELSITMMEAATQLDSLLKERFKLITDLADMKGRAMSAEQERDSLQARVKELEADYAGHLQWSNDKLDSISGSVARLQQERDEAYEVLKALSFLSRGPVSDLVKHAKSIGPSLHVLSARARDLVRRLAGPEKEDKK